MEAMDFSQIAYAKKAIPRVCSTGMRLGSRFIAQSKHTGRPAVEFEDLTIDAQ
jgi:hypothetical protein